MSRFGIRKSYGHSCRPSFYDGEWKISWVVDFYYSGSRLRYPRTFARFTDEAGAKKFCAKHGLDFPKRLKEEPLPL